MISPDGKTVQLANVGAEATASFASDHFARRYRGGLQELSAFFSGLGSSRNAFFNGKLAMQFNGSWEFNFIKTANPELEFGMSLRPSQAGVGVPGVHAGTFHYAIAGRIPHPDLAWELVKWLTLREESAGYFMFRQGRPSPVRAFNRNPGYERANPDWRVIGEALSRAASLPIFPFTREVVGVFNAAFNAAVRGDQSPGPVLKEAARRAQAVVDAYWAGAK